MPNRHFFKARAFDVKPFIHLEPLSSRVTLARLKDRFVNDTFPLFPRQLTCKALHSMGLPSLRFA